MRLLPSREVETHTIAKKTAETQRITAIRSQLSREERNLNDWNDSIEAKKSSAIKDFEQKILNKSAILEKIKREVKKLEKKREILLQPLDDTPEKITERLAFTENLLDYLKQRKEELAEARKTLELTQRQEDLQLQKLLRQEDELNQRAVEVEKRIEKIKDQELEFTKSVKKFTSESNEKNISLLHFEDRLLKKEVELAEREKLVAQDNEKIARDRKHIESQQQSLIAALNEIKNKN